MFNLVIGTHLVFMLCNRHSLTMLGNAACISRKRIDATSFLLHASSKLGRR